MQQRYYCPQVSGHGLLRGDHVGAAFFDLEALVVDIVVVVDDFLRGDQIPALQGIHCPVDGLAHDLGQCLHLLLKLIQF